jgi:hypothetical protein
MASPSVPSIKSYISCCDNSSLYVYTSRIIPELALLGCTDIAGRLLSRLNDYDFYHDSFPCRKLVDLWYLWDLRAKDDGVPWPEGEEEKVRRAVRERRAKERSSDGGTEENGSTVTRDDIQRELELRMTESDRPPTTTRMLIDARDIIQGFETAGSTPEISKVRGGLVEALELVLSAEAHHKKHSAGGVRNSRGAPTSEELLRWLAHSLGEMYHENLTIFGSRQAWKLYKSGALRQQLNVDEAALTSFANDFEIALTERLTNDRSRPSANMSVPELLEVAEHVTQAVKTNPNVQEFYAHVTDTSLFSSPATEAQIAEAEAQLGVTLPSDYTTFLRISDGTIGHMWDHSFCGYQPLLHPVDKLRWLDLVEEDYFTGLSLDIPARWDKWPFAPPPTATGYGGDSLEHFIIGRALEIGTEDIDNVWLLPPSTVTSIKEAVKKILEDENLEELDKNSVRTAVKDFAGSEEDWEKVKWACVTWASGGTAAMFVYPGFKAYLESVVGSGGLAVHIKDEGEDEGRKMLMSGRWLGSLFGNVGGGEEQEEVPKWLRDAVEAAKPPRRSNLTDPV